MPRWGEQSYTNLVYELLKSAKQPLTFQEIFDAVNRRRPVTTRNPKATIRGVLSQGRQLVSVGDGRYGYLPHIVTGSVLRIPLKEKEPANHPLSYPVEVRQALWPDFFENQTRRVRQPVHAHLPDGKEAILVLDMLLPRDWGSPMPEDLRRYLIDNRAEAGASLLVRIVDSVAGRCEMWYESRWRRDDSAIAAQNRDLADTIYQVLSKKNSYETAIWDLAVDALARGAYRSDVAPDTLEEVLLADRRFAHMGLAMWVLSEDTTPGEQAASLQRRGQLQGEIYQSDTPLEEAQELIYDAWDALDSQERVKLARRALQISPDCADAYSILAEETAFTSKEEARLYSMAVAAGERALGEDAFKEDVGQFWGIVETRPYMRAHLGLAQALWAMGQKQDAIAHEWEMLRLNPGDNQGVRYQLISWLIQTGDDAKVTELLDRYPDDADAHWLYGRALHAFRTEGDTKSSRRLLAKAKVGNPFVPAYLLGRKHLPNRLPDLVGIGDDSEAIVCADGLGPAWRETPGALEWLGRE